MYSLTSFFVMVLKETFTPIDIFYQILVWRVPLFCIVCFFIKCQFLSKRHESTRLGKTETTGKWTYQVCLKKHYVEMGSVCVPKPLKKLHLFLHIHILFGYSQSSRWKNMMVILAQSPRCQNSIEFRDFSWHIEVHLEHTTQIPGLKILLQLCQKQHWNKWATWSINKILLCTMVCCLSTQLRGKIYRYMD